MKSRLLIPVLLYLLVASSCSKEKIPGVAGKWLNTAVYFDPLHGGEGWVNELKYPQLLTLEANTRFYSFTDMPDGSGTYQYSRLSGTLLLKYDADQFGAPPFGSLMHEVEHLGIDKMITSITYPDGSIFKKEYRRLAD